MKLRKLILTLLQLYFYKKIFTVEDIANFLECSIRTANTYLAMLKRLGLVEIVDKKQRLRYRIKKLDEIAREIVERLKSKNNTPT